MKMSDISVKQLSRKKIYAPTDIGYYCTRYFIGLVYLIVINHVLIIKRFYCVMDGN